MAVNFTAQIVANRVVVIEDSARHPLDECEGRGEVGVEPEAGVFLAGRRLEAIVPRRDAIGKTGKLRPQAMVHFDPRSGDDEIGECPALPGVDRDPAVRHAEALPWPAREHAVVGETGDAAPGILGERLRSSRK